MTETGTGPAPTGQVAALARARGLGAWVERTFLPKKGLFLRKWEGSRLYFFVGGLVITGPGDFAAAYDWRTASVLQSVTSVNGVVQEARYTVFDRSGAAVGLGRGGDMLFPRQHAGLGITSLVKGAPFTFEGDWGPYIQQRIAEERGAEVLADLERGGTVPFGAVTLSRSGVTVQERSAAWDGLGDIRASDGQVLFPDAGGRRQALPSVPATHVANLVLFLAVCRHVGAA
ncbi:DUF6585 family protein [Streptomyces pilosus]|uniref:Uncharacterized protein n=1 Tax=Streptomyces pilosus TaxID=28893 RepID=A0A918F1C0_9ACTN|nr:DUF6585 family protein [Streptomyces pilosus]GGQ91747.1 hypothetical protein GCM10010280_44100 [Streptomyces pilosus]GGV43721.1 hypothetical protein GCM10010261_17150 [Streptomyces pilosus]